MKTGNTFPDMGSELPLGPEMQASGRPEMQASGPNTVTH